jgi:hypothetical protein
MRLVNVATKKSHPIQRIEVFTKTVGVELPLKNLRDLSRNNLLFVVTVYAALT